jgi:hypothetical protein
MILSVLLDREDSGTVSLRHASALVVPQACADVSWGNWRSSETQRPLSLCPESSPSEFIIEDKRWVAGRSTMSVDLGASWLAGVAEAAQAGDAHLPEPPGLPRFDAALRTPRVLVRVIPGTNQPAGLFLTSAARPGMGTVWPVDDRPDIVVPRVVRYRDDEMSLGHCLLGMLVPTQGGPASHPPFGLFVGRLERRAWLTEMRGDGPQFESLLVNMGWDPARIDLADLVLDLEQYISGDLVAQLRVSIEDAAGVEEVRDAGRCTISLPTYGAGVASQVTLMTRDGALLDRRGPHPLAERIEINLSIDGSPVSRSSLAAIRAPLGLEDREVRGRLVKQQVAELAAQGAEGRLLVDKEAADRRLRIELRTAQVELLVHDPYFGQHPDDWRLLDDVRVPVRVVTRKALDPPPRIASHVRARYRRNEHTMHDRFYLWNGGGIAIGGSPTTFGKAPVRVGRISAADSELLRGVFEKLWDSDLFHDVPRAQ